MSDTEWSEDRRALIELIDDLSSRLRNNCGSGEAFNLLEEALEIAERMD